MVQVSMLIGGGYFMAVPRLKVDRTLTIRPGRRRSDLPSMHLVATTRSLRMSVAVDMLSVEMVAHQAI